ncbi:hypothetical protein [Pseudomonas sp. FP198]|uniref:hypothetical protein n=1 Tax=Pseudomonas sp. FP198 TaxID=2954084 RepID=UPI002734F575|nr:hypothetical protein [Pseudomonas sp. FP198]WLG93851.1 hypothetical protein PSH78_15700 [Pseudomonas sp. FP198]
MFSEPFDLPVGAIRPAEKILKDIETAGSMILAVKNGARAHGFVIGLTCAGAITEEQADVILSRFDHATESRLRELALYAK